VILSCHRKEFLKETAPAEAAARIEEGAAALRRERSEEGADFLEEEEEKADEMVER